MSGISVETKITNISEHRGVRTRYGLRSVAHATLEDDTGSMKLSLWEEQINSVNIGDKVKISGAYVTEFRNELQLNIPRSGNLKTTEENVLEFVTHTLDVLISTTIRRQSLGDRVTLYVGELYGLFPFLFL